MRNVSFGFQESEDRQNLPGAFLDVEALPGQEDTGYVLIKTTSGDVRHAVNVHLADDLQNGLHVDFCRREKNFAQSLFGIQLRVYLMQIQIRVLHYFAHERKAVGVYAGGSDTDQHIAHFDFGAIDEFGLFYDSGRIARDVVFTVGIHTRHFCRFASYKGTTGLAASFRYTADNRLDLRRDVMSHCHVVQEDERFGSLRQNIVHAHRHGVNTDGVVFVHRKSDLQFGTNAVGSADQNRFFDSQRGEVKHASKRTDRTHRT